MAANAVAQPANNKCCMFLAALHLCACVGVCVCVCVWAACSAIEMLPNGRLRRRRRRRRQRQPLCCFIAQVKTLKNNFYVVAASVAADADADAKEK